MSKKELICALGCVTLGLIDKINGSDLSVSQLANDYGKGVANEKEILKVRKCILVTKLLSLLEE